MRRDRPKQRESGDGSREKRRQREVYCHRFEFDFVECAEFTRSRLRGVFLCRLNERKRSINTNVLREYRRFFYVHYIFTTSVKSNAVMILFILLVLLP